MIYFLRIKSAQVFLRYKVFLLRFESLFQDSFQFFEIVMFSSKSINSLLRNPWKIPASSNKICQTVCSFNVRYAFQSEWTLYSCLNVKNTVLEVGAKSEVQVTTTELEPTSTQFINEHSAIQQNWPKQLETSQTTHTSLTGSSPVAVT